ncbi:cytochrome c oxidase subunit II, partial [Xanthomonas perforans]
PAAAPAAAPTPTSAQAAPQGDAVPAAAPAQAATPTAAL